jgi:hypothetical protein
MVGKEEGRWEDGMEIEKPLMFDKLAKGRGRVDIGPT